MIPAKNQKTVGQTRCITEKLIPYLGFDDSAFNIEYYWDREKDRIWLLEVNTRVSQSHSAVFEMVDGASNQAITVDVADLDAYEGPSRVYSRSWDRIIPRDLV